MNRRPITHGTHSGWVRGCRCEECRVATKKYHANRYAETKKLKKVSSEIAREHIKMLNRYGLGSVAIADSCGVAPSTVRYIKLGRQRKIYQATERQILSVTPEGISDGAKVDARVARNLIRELRDEGWRVKDLKPHLNEKGWHPPKKLITAKRQMKIEKLYRRAMTTGLPSIEARLA